VELFHFKLLLLAADKTVKEKEAIECAYIMFNTHSLVLLSLLLSCLWKLPA